MTDEEADRPPQAGVVIATRNRRDDLLASLACLTALPEQPPVVVVDNASDDGTPEAVSARFPTVKLLALDRNRGAAARNLGVAELSTPYVAFCDDDSWLEPGSLRRAAAAFGRYPSLGLIAARILVGPERKLDPTSAAMAGATPPGLPGPEVDGFVACGALVRRRAFLDAGGFCEHFLIGGEEALLAIDMRAAGWRLCYLDEVSAVHMPNSGDRGDRSWLRMRNDLWTSWLRRPATEVARDTLALTGVAVKDPAARRALLSALRGLPWVLEARRVDAPPAAGRGTPPR